MTRWIARVYGYAKSGSGMGNLSFSVDGIITDSESEAKRIALSKAASMKPKHENFRIESIRKMS
jgi:hypothetical protein